MKKLLILAVLLLGTTVVPASAQAFIETQENLAKVWDNTHMAAHACVNSLTKLHTTPLEGQETSAEFEIADESCSIVLVGTYLISTSTANIDEFITSNNETQKRKEIDEMRMALSMMRASVSKMQDEQIVRLFPNFIKAVGLIQSNE